MAITTLDQAMVGMQPVAIFAKQLSAPGASGRWLSSWQLGGIPVQGGVNGTAAGGTYTSGPALSNVIQGMITRIDPGSPKRSYLARVGSIFSSGSGGYGIIYVCDRLWDDTISPTVTTAQTVSSVAWPARDDTGTTAGLGVCIGLEVSVATSTNAPTCTLTYTNSAGASGKTTGLLDATYASAPAGAFFRLGHGTGDRGIQSVQTFQLNVSWTAGSISLVAYRVLAALPYQGGANGVVANLDVLTGGMPRIWNGTVPFLLFENNNSTGMVSGTYQETWG